MDKVASNLEEFIDRMRMHDEITFELGDTTWFLMPRYDLKERKEVIGWMYYILKHKTGYQARWFFIVDQTDPVEVLKVPINGIPLIDQLDQVFV